jgi:hypothetical protein
VNWKRLGKKFISVPPRWVELAAFVLFFVIVGTGLWAIHKIPNTEFNRSEVLRVLEVLFAGLGVVGLLLVWAQLRYTATQNKLLSYHEYFGDLPSGEKVGMLYAALGRLNVNVPLWQAPLTVNDKDLILNDPTPVPNAEHAVREYLNEFEEFAAAVNSGLVDDEYAYHIESARPVNAYFGFRELIEHWLAQDQMRAARMGGVLPEVYYGELRKLAERWKRRKLREADHKAKEKEKKGVVDVL